MRPKSNLERIDSISLNDSDPISIEDDPSESIDVVINLNARINSDDFAFLMDSTRQPPTEEFWGNFLAGKLGI
jgi:hypothetical protein